MFSLHFFDDSEWHFIVVDEMSVQVQLHLIPYQFGIVGRALSVLNFPLGFIRWDETHYSSRTNWKLLKHV